MLEYFHLMQREKKKNLLFLMVLSVQSGVLTENILSSNWSSFLVAVCAFLNDFIYFKKISIMSRNMLQTILADKIIINKKKQVLHSDRVCCNRASTFVYLSISHNL